MKCHRDEMSKQNDGRMFQHSCSPCTVGHMNNTFCFYCLKACKDPSLLSDPTIWLSCCFCKRFIHMNCELRFSPGGITDSVTYICFECRHSKVHQGNALEGNKEKNSANIWTGNDSAAGSCSSTISFEIFSSSTKKKRMARERRRKPISFCVEDILQSPFNARDSDNQANPGEVVHELELPSNLHVPHEEDPVSAAKSAAVARATASAKALAAVKAAAAAKAALEDAAVAARAEAWARTELCRRSTWTETSVTTSGSSRSHEVVLQEVEKVNLKMDIERKGSPLHASLHDEELARLLHRAINSSPRISCSLTPRRKKARPELRSNMTADNLVTSNQPVPTSFSNSYSQSKQKASKMCSETHTKTNQPDLKIMKAKSGDHVALATTLPENLSSICGSFPSSLRGEDPKQQAIQVKLENNSSLFSEDSSGNKSPLSNLQSEHYASADIPVDYSNRRLGRESAPAYETKIFNFENALSKSGDLDEIQFQYSVSMAATTKRADIKIQEGIKGRQALLTNAISESTCKHIDKRKEDKLSRSKSSPEERKKSLLRFKKIINGIRSPVVLNNLPNEVAIIHQTDRPFRKREGTESFPSSPGSLPKAMAHLTFDKVAKKVDSPQKTSRHGGTEAGSKIAVSEVGCAKVQRESFSKVHSLRKTLSAPVPVEFLHTTAVSAVPNGHHRRAL
ncbi:hypothetical protein O6H91_07G043500 [Diphasiastrum complanatum]|nr:hypothetical protein O6H91_07G043500 [Diphasiastrum complanatum]